MQPRENDAERRPLSVMFCDLVDSTVLSDHLDPEDLRDVTSAYHEVCSAAIEHHEGHIAQYLGDGILVYFGYPTAHEDDARRAAQTALAILADIAELRVTTESGQVLKLQVRIGIHTGPVVVGEVGEGQRRENLALGRTPNVAARVQSFAEPGSVLLSDETLRLVEGYFETESVGSHALKGLSEPVTMHRLLRASGAETRLEAGVREGLTPFTGRTGELEQLRAQWRYMLRGEEARRAAMISGEAGIGKSRLVASLKDDVEKDGYRTVVCRCSTYYVNSFLYPVIRAMEDALDFTADTTDADKWSRLTELLRAFELFSDDNVHLLGSLLSITPPGNTRGRRLSPADQRDMTLHVVRLLLGALASDNPTLFVVEDLHWADPSTLELLDGLISSPVSPQMMFIGTFRTEFRPAFAAHPNVAAMNLDRLGQEACSSIVDTLVGGRKLPDQIRQLLIRRSEGVPLHAEEITKSVLELGILEEHGDRYELSGPMPTDLVPATLQGSLLARLDRLPDAKPVAQLAAIIGREFQRRLLEQVTDLSSDDLTRALQQLQDAELIYEMDSPTDFTYQFKHALIQDAAYQSLLKSARRVQHRNIAEFMFAEMADDKRAQNAEVIAHHFAAGGEPRQAADLWLKAGQTALTKAAYHDTIAHITHALEQLALLEDNAERADRELRCNSVMIGGLQATQGWGSPDVERYCNRSIELTEAYPNPERQAVLLTHILSLRTLRGEMNEARRLATERLQYASEHLSQMPGVVGMAHATLCVTELYQGDIDLAIRTGETAISMIDEEQNAWLAWHAGLAPHVNTCSYLSEAWWMRGYPERGREYSRKAFDSARAVAHGPSDEFAVGYQAEFYQLLKDHERVLEIAAESQRLAAIQRSEFWNPMITVYKGWATSVLGDLEDGISLMKDGLRRYRAAGNGITQIHLLALLAEGLMVAQRWAEALDICLEAERVSAHTGESYYLPEIHRIKAQIFRHTAKPGEAARAIVVSAMLAQQQGALSLSLRAAMTACELSDSEDGKRKTGKILSNLYDAFTEGFDTPDLKKAAVLKQELAL